MFFKLKPRLGTDFLDHDFLSWLHSLSSAPFLFCQFHWAIESVSIGSFIEFLYKAVPADSRRCVCSHVSTPIRKRRRSSEVSQWFPASVSWLGVKQHKQEEVYGVIRWREMSACVCTCMLTCAQTGRQSALCQPMELFKNVFLFSFVRILFLFSIINYDLLTTSFSMPSDDVSMSNS